MWCIVCVDKIVLTDDSLGLLGCPLRSLRCSLSSRLEIDFKNGLVGLKDHTIVHLVVLVEIQPRSVRARLAIYTIC